jgi:hypothetical protein
MLRNYIKWLLFLSSYIPLYAILLLFTWKSNWNIFYSLIGLILITFITLLISFKSINSLQKTYIKVKRVDPKNGEFIGYIFTYILPFLSSNFSDIKYVIGMGLFFILVGFMYVRSNLIYTNPILNLLGYSLYEIEDNKENMMVLITKESSLRKESNIKVINIGKNVYLGDSL